jgi:hypothetical protein
VDESTLVIANGFSCREQIAQTTPRRALHLAQVLQLALRGSTTESDEARPLPAARTIAALGAVIGAVAFGMWRKSR